ncbi:hypothetical protein KSP39_PZI001769 [Platanthera zijinensis]|uniref:tRNA-uridine aminocarboxypropyltransferase n=1 Tax=Platanthera zijinensis TaxID=2320716 RepID=A0AAP0C0E1_9ASPA
MNSWFACLADKPCIGSPSCRGKKIVGGSGQSSRIHIPYQALLKSASKLSLLVEMILHKLELAEEGFTEPATICGSSRRTQGTLRIQEDVRHREVYQSLSQSEEKIQFFSARQIACRLLGSRGYLCQKCWIAMEDCMCSKLVPCSFCERIRFWLYMHPKDFLRQNNTGKLLWQLFGVHAASLCLFGVHEHEEIMWDAFKTAGDVVKDVGVGVVDIHAQEGTPAAVAVKHWKSKVWFLYPNQNVSPKSVKDIFSGSLFTDPTDLQSRLMDQKQLNFVLIDGTWSNSSAMFRRLKERWAATWDEKYPPCLSLSSTGASVMHKLRPQPAWDRTCTAAAAAGLLSELHHHPELHSYGLDKHAEEVENALDGLLESLTARRVRMGRSITRRERHNNCI